MFIIEEYLMVHTDFDSLASCFQIFIILRLRYYILNLSLNFLNTIVKTIDKAVERKISLINL